MTQTGATLLDSPIADVSVRVFTTATNISIDTGGHQHPGPITETKQALLTITDSDGVSGSVLGKPTYLREDQVVGHFRPLLLGKDPFSRETLSSDAFRRSRSRHVELSDHTLSYLDQALWDYAGQKLGAPIWKLLGASRPKMPAYASIMCGDDIPGGLSTPEDYANFAKDLVAKGYQGIKLHTWMPPIPGAPNVNRDIEACEAVRDAVGPGIALMLDGYHWYSRIEALRIGKALDRLQYAWFEEPMDEYSSASYKWLADQIDTPVIGPETTMGRHRSRAEWITTGACDILRVGVMNGGGITPALKAAHLADAFGMDCEIHGNGSPNLQLLGGMTNAVWYERGLLHPHVDYDWVPPHLNSIVDQLDPQGYVAMPTRPGLAEDIDLEYIEKNTVAVF